MAGIGSCSTVQQPVELSENILQNLFYKLPPQRVEGHLFHHLQGVSSARAPGLG